MDSTFSRLLTLIKIDSIELLPVFLSFFHHIEKDIKLFSVS